VVGRLFNIVNLGRLFLVELGTNWIEFISGEFLSFFTTNIGNTTIQNQIPPPKKKSTTPNLVGKNNNLSISFQLLLF